MMPAYEEVVADYRTVGLSLRAHPISFYREALDRLKITPARDLPAMQNGQQVRVAGLVLLRQRPSTAKGITFVTLEDETGTINLVVHQGTWDRFYRIARRAPAWIAHGHVQTTAAKKIQPARLGQGRAKGTVPISQPLVILGRKTMAALTARPAKGGQSPRR